MAKRIAAANGASKDRHFLQACRELLEFPILSVPVGAAGGVREWGELATLCAVHAFEPRQNSFAELQRSLTESRQQYLKIHNTGLARTTGRHRLYVTRIPQASSLIKPKPASLLLKRWRQDNGFDVTQELEVDCISLAQFVQEENLSRIDFLKLDTQGSELDILRGGAIFCAKFRSSSVRLCLFSCTKGSLYLMRLWERLQATASDFLRSMRVVVKFMEKKFLVRLYVCSVKIY